MTLEGKVAIVTGAAGGIGAGCARRLAREGAALALHYRSQAEAAEELAKEIRDAGGRAETFQADLADPDAATALVCAAVSAFGGLDILVNNAAVGRPAPLEAIDAEHLRRHFGANVASVIFTTQAAAAAFGESGGCIVNISSVNAARPVPGASVYSASKAAVEALTKSLAAELAPRRIRVNAVAPGATDTAMLRAAHKPEVLEEVAAKTLLGQRLGQPEDIAAVVAFLAGPDAAWITGQVLNASGGLQI